MFTDMDVSVIRCRNVRLASTTFVACNNLLISCKSSLFVHMCFLLHSEIRTFSSSSFLAGRRNSNFSVSKVMPRKVNVVAGPSSFVVALSGMIHGEEVVEVM